MVADGVKPPDCSAKSVVVVDAEEPLGWPAKAGAVADDAGAVDEH